MINGEHTIEALHVAKSFGRRGVLKDVTFGLRRGEIAGIAGENGAGRALFSRFSLDCSRPQPAK